MNDMPDRPDQGAGAEDVAARPAQSAAGADADARSAVFELAPEKNPSRWETMVAGINERARPILEARRRDTVSGTLMGWRRPVLTATATLAAAAIAVLALLPADDADSDETAFVEAMVPWSVAAWIDGSYAPTIEELVRAVEEYAP